MVHGHDASSISTAQMENQSPGTLAFRGQQVIEKLQEAHQFAQTLMAITQES